MPKKENNNPQHQCSFCKRNIIIHDQYDLPIYDPNTGFAICKECLKEIYHFLEANEKQESIVQEKDFAMSLEETIQKIKPHVIKQYLDEYIIEQDQAKKVLATAVYNHMLRIKMKYMSYFNHYIHLIL